jgi:hypothetical protein
MPQGEDTTKGNTSGLFGLDGNGMTGGIFDESAMLHLQKQFFPPKDQVPYSPGFSDASVKRARGKKD